MMKLYGSTDTNNTTDFPPGASDIPKPDTGDLD
jgi:hypothetical protein